MNQILFALFNSPTEITRSTIFPSSNKNLRYVPGKRPQVTGGVNSFPANSTATFARVNSVI